MITTSDGRSLAYDLLGDPDGQPVFEMHGCPGCRLDSRGRDPEVWGRCGVRLVAYDRPGYGRSMRHPGRSVADCAADVVAIADALGIERFFITGTSGGGPHALAVATLVPERVLGCAAICTFAPLNEDDLQCLSPINRDSYWRVRSGGWDALAEELAPIRERFLADPVQTIRDLNRDAPPSDQAILSDPEKMQASASSLVESLSPGLEGWVDDSYAINLHWDFDPSRIENVPVTFWLGELDTATPRSAVMRLAELVPRARTIVWEGEGHRASQTHKKQTILELLRYPTSRTAAGG